MPDSSGLAVIPDEIVPKSGSSAGNVRFVILGTGLSGATVQFTPTSGKSVPATTLDYAPSGDWLSGYTPTWDLGNLKSEDVEVDVTSSGSSDHHLKFKFTGS